MSAPERFGRILFATGMALALVLASLEARAVPDPQSVRTLLEKGRWAAAESTARVVVAAARIAPGPDSIAYVEALDLLVEPLAWLAKARRLETRELAETAVRIKRRARGPRSPELASSLLGRGQVRFWAGEVAAAREDFRRALSIRDSVFGGEHPLTAEALAYLARAIADSSERAAEPFFARALTIRQKALPADHPDLARSIYQLGWVRRRMGDLDTARVLLERALAIQERVLPPEHPHLGTTLWQNGYLQYILGDHPRMRELDERALTILESALGSEHPDVGWVHNDLGLMAIAVEDFPAARLHLPKAVDILTKNPGQDPSAASIARMNLASLHVWLAEYPEARREFDQALSLKERVRGRNHQDVGVILQMYGQLFDMTGDLTSAQAMYERAFEILVKARGRNRAVFGTVASTLASVLSRRGEFARAESLFAEALAAREATSGPASTTVGDMLGVYAAHRLQRGDLAGCRQFAERGLSITRSNEMGRDFEAYLWSLLASADHVEGRLQSAKAYLVRAESLEVVSLGPRHPSLGYDRAERAELLAEMGDRQAALQLALEAEALGHEHVTTTISAFSERQALAYAANRPTGLDLALTLASGAVDARARSRTWDAVLRGRALVLDEFGRRHRQVSQIGRLARTLSDASERLANLAVRGAGDDPEAYRTALEQAREEKEKAELELAASSADFRRERDLGRAGYSEVAASLPERSTLVAYVAYSRWEGRRKRLPGSTFSPDSLYVRTPSYLAFVLRAGSEPEVVPLGPRAVVDSLVARWSEEVTRGARLPKKWVKEAAYRPVGEALRRAVWDPVASYLDGSQRVFVVPDGALHLVNFTTLPMGESSYLLESGPLLHLLSAERDLLLPEALAHGSGLLAMGGVDFDGPLNPALAVAEADEAPLGAGAGFRGGRATCGNFEALRWRELVGTAAEVRKIASWWNENAASSGAKAAAGKAVVLLHGDASESAFKQLAPQRRVLHLATHGFFLGCGVSATTSGSILERQGPPPLVENPFLLSGLALAGANHRREAALGSDDGVLTAEEVAALDLGGVEWAVLSACETGVGEVRAGEGVFGLRRAFQLAGARTLVMSLWPVEDEATRRWMEGLYDARLRRGLGTAESVREASLTMLRECRERHETTHPFYWGAFVAAGEWR